MPIAALTPVLVAGALGSSQPPRLPLDFYTGVQGLILSGAGEYATNNARCCSKDAAACSVQTQAKGWDIIQEGSRNRSIHRSAGGVVLTWAEPVRKVMLLEPAAANSSHKWACSLYCPFTDDFVSKIAIAPEKEKVEDIGTRNVAQPAAVGGVTKSCEGYQWTQRVLKFFPVTTNVLYVDPSTSPPRAFKSTSSFTRFITKLTGQANSSMNESFIGFDPSFDVAKEIDVDMASIASCKKSKDQCPSTASYGARLNPWRGAPHSLADLAAARLGAMSREERAALEARHRAELATADDTYPSRGGSVAPVVFPPSYTAHKQYSSRMAEGSSVAANGDTCCSEEAPVCVAQIQHTTATEYQDVPSQRMRTEHADGSVVVDDFHRNRTMLVGRNQSGVETCLSYCPIPSIFPRLQGFTLPNGTVDRGPTTLDGHAAELFEWRETILKILQMSATRFYAHVPPNGSATPLFQSETLTPFGGPPIGTQNVTWMTYVPGRPPAAKFAIEGVDTCPKSKRCVDPVGAFQTHRRITGQARAWDAPLFAEPDESTDETWDAQADGGFEGAVG